MKTLLLLVLVCGTLVGGLFFYEKTIRQEYLNQLEIVQNLGRLDASAVELSNFVSRYSVAMDVDIGKLLENFVVVNDGFNNLRSLSVAMMLMEDTEIGDVHERVDELNEQLKNIITTMQNNGLPAADALGLMPPLTSKLLEDLSSLDAVYTNHFMKRQQLLALYIAILFIGFCLLCLLLIIILMVHHKKKMASMEVDFHGRNQQVSVAYQKLKDSQDRLIQSEKMSSLGQMVAGITHEINTPLSYVSSNLALVRSSFDELKQLVGYVDVAFKESMKKSKDSDSVNKAVIEMFKYYQPLSKENVISEANELLSDSVHGLEDMSEVVNNLRTFARLDRQAIERFDVCVSLDNTLKVASNILRKTKVEVDKKFIDGAFIEGNPSKLNQVFLNVINNACHAMAETGGQLTVIVEKMNHTINISFKDTGAGMDKATRAKIFDPFYTTKPVGEGTGLGMSISYKIIKEHKGQIDVESGVGKGTTITLRLPLKLLGDSE